MEVSTADGASIRLGTKHSRCRIGIQDLQGSVDEAKPSNDGCATCITVRLISPGCGPSEILGYFSESKCYLVANSHHAGCFFDVAPIQT